MVSFSGWRFDPSRRPVLKISKNLNQKYYECQNESNELQNEVQKTEELQRGTEDLSDLAKDVVIADVNGVPSRLGPNDAFISCHDNYNNSSGNACVWVDGQQFNVTWTTVYSTGPSGHSYPEVNYVATPASFCGC